MKLPPVTQEPLEHVDATPDERYALRILQAHRENCNCIWVVEGVSKAEELIYEAMNEAAKKRAVILDRAIAQLEAALKEEEHAEEG